MGKSFPPLEKEMTSSNVAIPTNNVWRPQTSIKNGKHKLWSYNLERDSLNVNVDELERKVGELERKLGEFRLTQSSATGPINTQDYPVDLV